MASRFPLGQLGFQGQTRDDQALPPKQNAMAPEQANVLALLAENPDLAQMLLLRLHKGQNASRTNERPMYRQPNHPGYPGYVPNANPQTRLSPEMLSQLDQMQAIPERQPQGDFNVPAPGHPYPGNPNYKPGAAMRVSPAVLAQLATLFGHEPEYTGPELMDRAR